MDKGVLSLTEKALRPVPMAADAPPMIDPHFHFLDPVQNPEQHVRGTPPSSVQPGPAPADDVRAQATLLSAHPDLTPYLPEDYKKDFANLNVAQSVHMEVIPDNFVQEVEWVQSMKAAGRCPWVARPNATLSPRAAHPPPPPPAERGCARGQGGIVAAADPSQPDFGEVLTRCAAATDMLKGIRWILNCKPTPLCPAASPRPALSRSSGLGQMTASCSRGRPRRRSGRRGLARSRTS